MKYFFCIILLILSYSVKAAHIAGGELIYEYVGPGNTSGTNQYLIILRLFRECNSTGPQLTAENVIVGAYNQSSASLVATAPLSLVGGLNIIQLSTNAIPCLTGDGYVCYQVATYTGTIELPINPEGYVLTWSRCCRANGLLNVGSNNNLGATYSTKIPGTLLVGSKPNNSPKFVVKDTALVCSGKPFILDFAASDPDSDSISYSFCTAYGSGTSTSSQPPQNLTLNPINMGFGFSPTQPLGSLVTINPKTGLISGTAPIGAGRYVVSVCATEWRDGKPINEHRKDFILKVGDCDFLSAKLKSEYLLCNSFTQQFVNESTSPGITGYQWNIMQNNTSVFSSNAVSPTFTFPDTGNYRITLTVSNGICTDTTSAPVRVYPGFKANFEVDGSCIQIPFNFKDKSQSRYGTINKWYWKFNDPNQLDDTSNITNPSYLYKSLGNFNAKLIVQNTYGCIDSIIQTVLVNDKPNLKLSFRDTLICSIDSLVLQSNNIGTMQWSPNYNILNSTTNTPTVFPKRTTTYTVKVNQNGCIAEDSVVVNVLDFITVQLGNDTVMCATDSITLNPISEALSYSWFPSISINDPSLKNPKVSPGTTTTYYVTANLGKCQDKDSITVFVDPYPIAQSIADTVLCFGEKVNLTSKVVADSYHWQPTTSMINTTSLNPTVGPSKTTTYYLYGEKNGFCPKTVIDTIVIRVMPPVYVNAGNDTSIVVNQPLQLKAQGNGRFLWSPSIGVSNTNIANPIIKLGEDVDSITYVVQVTDSAGCFAKDEMTVKIYKADPSIFVPSAFTPNYDGLNDVLKPILVGMQGLDFFRIYNRSGELIYSTSTIGEGWDGTVKGTPQSSGTYVYTAMATDYTGKKVKAKGSVVLIR